MSQVRAPYNFVPLSQHVFFPKLADDALVQDVPYADGLCGTFQVRVIAETPIFVRGTDTGDVAEFFTTPDGRFAIPGSSLRGMLRNVIEIASFGKLSRFNDDRYSMRDLNAGPYTRYMNGPRRIPKVTAAWLVKSDDPARPARLLPCHFGKVSHTALRAEANKRRVTLATRGENWASAKYTAWGVRSDRDWREACRVSVRMSGPPDRRAASAERGAPGEYRHLVNLGGEASGVLVFTGQAGAKQHEFVFYEGEAALREFIVSPEAYKDFEGIHSNRGQQNRTTSEPNEEWKFWKPRFERGEPIPVFALFEPRQDQVQLRSFGLAMMFRLAYRYRIGNAVRNAQPESSATGLDLAELLFGKVDGGSEGARSLKGRVSVGLAIAEQNPLPEPLINAVLAAPRPSFYPAYLEQGSDPNVPCTASVSPHDYKTLMTEGVRVRGWKRYRPQSPSGRADSGNRAERGSDRQADGTTFRPLPSETTFVATVRVHNVRPWELGALLWAMDFGGDPEARHGLGMAKPYGYGRVRLELVQATLERNDTKLGSVDLIGQKTEYVESFTNTMKTWCGEVGVPGGWAGSLQLEQLLACARPLPPESPLGEYMELREFARAKRSGWILPPATPPNPQRRPPPQSARPGPGRAPQRAGEPHRAATRITPRTPEQQDAEAERKELEAACREGKQIPILRRWIAEGGAKEERRRAIAKTIQVTRKMRQGYPDIIEWIEK